MFKLFSIALILLGFELTGCQSHKVVAKFGQGYQEVDHAQRFSFDENPLTRTSFEYKGTNGQTVLIWPALYGVGEIVHDDLAIFVGERGYLEAGDRVTHPRLFAVKAPELPLDITDEVLWRWAKTSGSNFTKTRERFSLVIPEEKNGQLSLHLEFITDDPAWADKSALLLDWSQVSEIMAAVKKKGVVEKDLRWRTPFIGEEF